MPPSYRLPSPVRRLGRTLPKPLRRRVVRRWFPPQPPWLPGFDWDPPPCPPGMEVGTPEFIGLGVGRSGTTWWWQLIRKHPQVYNHPALHRERRFLEHAYVRESPKGPAAERYAAWFPRPPGTIAGEWTPWYLSRPWIGQALAVVAPEARLLVMLRDPVERLITALTVNREQPWYELMDTTSYQYAVGLYAHWLALLEQHVERERLLVLQYEQCTRDPEAQLARTFEFLDLEPFVPDDLRKRVNETLSPKVELDPERHRCFVRAYQPDVDELVARYQEIDRSLWPNFA